MSTGHLGSPRRSGMNMRGVPIGGIILVALGVLLLLQTTGVVPWNIWAVLWRFWPVLLIALGINIVLGHRTPLLSIILIALLVAGSLLAAAFFTIGSESVSVSPEAVFNREPLEGLKTVDVLIGFGAGKLVVNSLPDGSPMLMEGKFEGVGAETSLQRSGNSGQLEISMRPNSFPLRFANGVEWLVSLSPIPAINLDLDGGASNMELDLRDLKVSDLTIETGASSVEITMPANSGHVNARIEGGASSINVFIPAGVAARIVTDSGLSSVNIDGRRFPEVNGAHVSPDFDTAVNRIDLIIESGVSSIDIS